MKRFRGGLVFKAHRLVYHSTLGVRVIKKKGQCLVEDLVPGALAVADEDDVNALLRIHLLEGLVCSTLLNLRTTA